MKLSIFGKRLSERRKALGIEQADLAEYTKLHRNTISNYENGNREPTLKSVTMLAKKLHCTTDYLLGADEEPEPPTTDVPAWVLPLVEDLKKIKTKTGRNSVKLVVQTVSKTKNSL